MKIRIKTSSLETMAELNNSNTAIAVWNALPINGKVNLWGDEIYFFIPVHTELEDGKETVNAGDLGFWPAGDAFCIFFGETPISKKGEIRPASAVNVFGKVIGDTSIFKKVKAGEKIVVEKINE